MSRYVANKVMRLVTRDPPSLTAYVADPAAFVDEYLSSHPADRAALTEAERTALEHRDYGALYRLGAHPYLLWSFTEAVWVPAVSRPELVESFRTAAAAVGYPDWATTPEPGRVDAGRASGNDEDRPDRVDSAHD
jgi:hypothetical protein